MIYSDAFDSPLGKLGIYEEDGALRRLEFYDEPKLNPSPLTERVKRWLSSYFNGENPAIDFEIEAIGTRFQNVVWSEIKRIPYGKILTYGDIALRVRDALGLSGIPYQAVGSAVGRNPIPIIVPCHRVVSKRGIGGFSLGLDVKRRLMEIEHISAYSI